MKKKSLYFKEHPFCLYQSNENAPFPLPTNSLGLVGKKEYKYIKDTNTKRILVIGSSPVERLPPALENKKNNPNLTFTHLLEEELNLSQKSSNNNQTFEVLNLSSSGYTTYECLISYLCKGRYLKPDLVISYQGINDVLWSVLADDFKKDYSHTRKNNFKKNECWINNLFCALPDHKLIDFLDSIFIRFKLKKPNGLIYSISKENLEIDPKFDSKKLDSFIQNINSLNALCELNNSKLLNLTFLWDIYRPMCPANVYKQLNEKKYKLIFDKFYNKYLREINQLLIKTDGLKTFELPEKEFTANCFSDGLHFSLKGMKKMAKKTTRFIYENQNTLFI